MTSTDLLVGETVYLKCVIIAADYSDEHVTYKVQEFDNKNADHKWVCTSNVFTAEEIKNG